MSESFEFRNPAVRIGFAQILHIMTLDPELSDGAYRTYATYLLYAQQHGSCHPARDTMANTRHSHKSTITRHNAQLVRLGYITRAWDPLKGVMKTYIEDPEQNLRLVKLAQEVLDERDEKRAAREDHKRESIEQAHDERKNAPSDSAKMRSPTTQKCAHPRAQKCAVEEEPLEEEPHKNNHEEQSSTTPGGVEDREAEESSASHEISTDLESSTDHSRTDLPAPVKACSSEEKNYKGDESELEKYVAACLGPPNGQQRRRLRSAVAVGEAGGAGQAPPVEEPAPAILYAREEGFRALVDEKIDWAKRKAAQEGKPPYVAKEMAINLICNYNHPFGWLNWRGLDNGTHDNGYEYQPADPELEANIRRLMVECGAR